MSDEKNFHPAPSQAKPSQAIANRKYLLGNLRALVERVVPVSSSLYKFLYLGVSGILSSHRNRRLTKLHCVAWVTDACNLNCFGCCTFSPLAKSTDMVDVDKFECDVKRLAELVDGEIESFLLMGGEPLLHPDINRLMEISRQCFAKGEVSILTNGVLLAKMDEVFWDGCYRNKIKVTITPYPIKLDYEHIISTAERYHVELIYHYTSDKETFRKLPLDISGKHDISKNFKRCTYSPCNTFRDGKMYGCNMPAYIDRFNEYFGQNLKVSAQDYVDVHLIKSKEEIFDLLCRPIPFCRYCDVDGSKFGLPWGISKKDIKEWT